MALPSLFQAPIWISCRSTCSADHRSASGAHGLGNCARLTCPADAAVATGVSCMRSANNRYIMVLMYKRMGIKGNAGVLVIESRPAGCCWALCCADMALRSTADRRHIVQDSPTCHAVCTGHVLVDEQASPSLPRAVITGVRDRGSKLRDDFT